MSALCPEKPRVYNEAGWSVVVMPHGDTRYCIMLFEPSVPRLHGPDEGQYGGYERAELKAALKKRYKLDRVAIEILLASADKQRAGATA
jgi:hypothetical protein